MLGLATVIGISQGLLGGSIQASRAWATQPLSCAWPTPGWSRAVQEAGRQVARNSGPRPRQAYQAEVLPSPADAARDMNIVGMGGCIAQVRPEIHLWGWLATLSSALPVHSHTSEFGPNGCPNVVGRHHLRRWGRTRPPAAALGRAGLLDSLLPGS